jgi:hypothetical protein
MLGCEGWKQVYVAPSDRTVLERLIAHGKTLQKLAVRARIVLLSGRGFGTMAIARETSVTQMQASEVIGECTASPGQGVPPLPQEDRCNGGPA